VTEPLRFDEWLPVPAVRRRDPATSHTAAARLRPNTQLARLAVAYRDGGDLTDDEAGTLSGLRQAGAGYWKRCSDLRKANIIEPTGETRPGASGEQQRVCRLTAFGVLATANL